MPNRTSWLGLAEILIASALLWLVAVEFDYWPYLLGVSLAAPLLLLRTRQSTVFGWRWFRTWLAREEARFRAGSRPRPVADTRRWTVLYEEGRYLVRDLWFCLKVAVMGLLCRLAATLTLLHRRPLASLRAIPANWKVCWFETNLRTPIEIVPSAGMYPVPRSASPPSQAVIHARPRIAGLVLLAAMSGLFLTLVVGLFLLGTVIGVVIWGGGWAEVVPMLTGGDKYGYASYVMLVLGPLGAWLWLPRLVSFGLVQLAASVSAMGAWYYRWSLKSSLFVYAPFVYFTSDSFNPRKAASHLADVRRTLISKIVLVYSAVVGGSFLLKYFALIVGYKLALAAQGRLGEYAELFLQPVRICLWQVLAILSGLITIGVFLYCDREQDRRGRVPAEGHTDNTVAVILGTATYARVIIAYYTASCTLWIIWSIVRQSEPFPRTWALWP